MSSSKRKGQQLSHRYSWRVFGASSVNIQVVYFVKVTTETDFAKVREQVYFGVYEAMYQHAKGFAYPTQFEISGPEVNESTAAAAKPGNSLIFRHFPVGTINNFVMLFLL